MVARPIGPIVFPEELPVSARRDEIAAAIRAHQVVIVSGETGSGKTTQLPKICLSIGRGLGAGGHGLIGHTQPRRLAATATARRIAEELGSPLGDVVGFKIRFHDRLAPGASVKLMTDGILLAETQGDPLLYGYDTIIIDEAHERSLNIDFLLGYLKRILPQRPDLKLIVTSATIDADRFATHFGSVERPAPVIEVSGRLYPVEVRYRPVQDQVAVQASKPRGDAPRPDERGLMDAVVDAVDELARVGPGDILVFFPGEREIREAAALLQGHAFARSGPHPEILPLFARLSAEDQERVFQSSASSGARRIVLATNVAETSLTVPGIRYVVDTGQARVKRYSYRNKVEQLRTEPISRAAANQRAGRCGRVAAGVCIRLYDEADFDARPAFTEPEILRSSLAGVILRMKSLGLGDIDAFPFLEPPLPRAVTDGYQLLSELGALDDDNALTPIGVELGRLPLDPRIGRMLLAARGEDCMAEMLVLAAALSIQDPRDRPAEAREAADDAHRLFVDDRSDFLSDLKLWDWYVAAAGGEGEHRRSQRQLRDLCRARFVSPLRMREWRDVHRQLATTAAEHRWRVNGRPATYEQVHRALLAGLLGNIGLKTDDESRDGPFLGARGIRFSLWPGSALARKGPAGSAKARWVMAAELVETQRLFARKVARIEPEWVESVGAHLVRTSYGDPHWEKKVAAVIVLERGVVHGLPIYQQRRVDHARRDAADARRIFLREGLVETMLHRERDQPPPFVPRDPAAVRMLAHNRRQVAAVEELEHRTRRPDVLVDAELLVAFCDERVPADVANGHAFEIWYREASRQDARLMFLDRDELMRHEAAGTGSDAFPKTISMGGAGAGSIAFALDYRFDPGTPRDGVTMTVPLYALNVVDAARGQWLVPGMLKEKVLALVKSLPQKLRRHAVPLPEYAQSFVDTVAPDGGLIEALIADLRERRNVVALAADFKDEAVPAHLSINYRVVDEHGRQLAMGRNLAALRAELGQQARHQFREAFAQAGGMVARDGEVVPAEPKAAPAVATSSAAGAAAGAPTRALSGDAPLTDWTFGVLPELLELRRGGQSLIGYPALVDQRSHVTLEVFDEPEEAARVHRVGLARLFRLQLGDQIRQLEKNLPELTRMAMQYLTLGSAEELRDQIVAVAVERACLADPLPTDAASFGARRADAKGRLVLLANEVARTVGTILDQYQATQKKLTALRAHPAARADVEAQLGALMHPRFVATTPPARLAHLARYLKAVALRVDKLLADPARDAQRMAEIAPLARRWQQACAAAKGAADPGLAEYRWLLEELRVALFAQELRTPMPVSVKRLTKVWDSLQR